MFFELFEFIPLFVDHRQSYALTPMFFLLPFFVASLPIGRALDHTKFDPRELKSLASFLRDILDSLFDQLFPPT